MRPQKFSIDLLVLVIRACATKLPQEVSVRRFFDHLRLLYPYLDLAFVADPY